ncbi:SDR family oxidoreductase [Parafrankia sp. EUN1f]|uniref:SDR family oxidoreductase n=1 Tax=Parafrankia sp. EUN1f TaxID=102897 RepID=UPI0001C45A82|nr:SDR family oxidoreductase [Parafrankia sp. EUN1f]EFC82333.1 Male sterility domain protein [Parafrankia sp. EUN1f]
MATAVTGPTGFLGLRLVRALLDRDHDEPLILLAHTGSTAAIDRLSCFLTATGAGPRRTEELLRRVRVVDVDVARPRLGLTETAFGELAGQIDVLWHSAASTSLSGELADLRRVNVDGTRHVLELAAAGARRPVVHHVSTAFVVGRRSDPVIYEDDLALPADGFETDYEHTKYDAEVLVHEWSAEADRPAVVYRPSILVTDQPPRPDLPEQTLTAVTRAIVTVAALAVDRGLGTGPQGPGRVQTIRIVGNPRASWNMMPVEDAARDMARIAQRVRPRGVSTFHIVHGENLPVSTLCELLESQLALRMQLVADYPRDPTALEELIYRIPGFPRYLEHRHVFDDTRARTTLGERTSDTRVDRDYLLSAIGAATAPKTRDALGDQDLDQALSERLRAALAPEGAR